MPPRRFLALTVLLIAALLPGLGCRGGEVSPDLGALYDAQAMRLSAELDRNPVIVIPGILGSRLEGPDGQVVWGQFGSGSVDPNSPEGRELVVLPADGVDPDVRATQVLDRVRVSFFGVAFEQAAYENLLRTLGTGGYLDRDMAAEIDYGDEHFTCFQFPYDWRRELSTSAIELHAFLEEARDYVRAERTRIHGRAAVEAAGPIEFDIVAHSMGGLVLRYYLMYGPTPLDELPDDAEPTWAGADMIGTAIIVGTPHRGAVDALVTLGEGKQFGPILPKYPAQVMRTMPAIWQLLPQWEVAPGHDGPAALLRLIDAQGSSDELTPPARAAELADVSRKFHALIGREAPPPDDLRLCLFAADAEPTASRVRLDGGRVRITDREPGDGTVTRFSALFDRDLGPNLDTPVGWDRVQFLHTDHLGMTRDAGFTDNVLFLLLVATQ